MPVAAGPEPPAGEASAAEEASFAEAARQAGLVVPGRRRIDPLLAVGVTLILIGVAMWAGFATHGFNPTVAAESRTCLAPALTMYGALAPDLDASTAGAYRGFASTYLNWTAKCFAVEMNSTESTDAFSPLTSASSEFVVVGSAPTASALAALPYAPIVFPLTVGALEVVYHPPTGVRALNLTSSLLTAIALGTLHNWSAPKLVADNPGLAGLPPEPIHVVYLGGATSVTSELTAYLSETNATWRTEVGNSDAPTWASGPTANSTSALVDQLVTTPGSIGFVSDIALPELADWGLGVATVENEAGHFASPNATGLSEAATSAAEHVAGSEQFADPTLTTANATGTWSYPLTMFSYVVMYEAVDTAYAGRLSATAAWHLLSYFQWASQLGSLSGAAAAVQLAPSALVNVTETALQQVTYDGTSILLGGPETELPGENENNETGEF